MVLTRKEKRRAAFRKSVLKKRRAQKSSGGGRKVAPKDSKADAVFVTDQFGNLIQVKGKPVKDIAGKTTVRQAPRRGRTKRSKPTTRAEIVSNLLKKQGAKDVKTDQFGNVTARKGRQQIVVTRQGRILKGTLSEGLTGKGKKKKGLTDKQKLALAQGMGPRRDESLEIKESKPTKEEAKKALRRQIITATPEERAVQTIITGKPSKGLDKFKKDLRSKLSGQIRQSEDVFAATARRVDRQPLSREEKIARVLAAAQLIGARTIRGLTTPFLFPVQTVRGILRLLGDTGRSLTTLVPGGRRPQAVGSVADVLAEFTRDPIGTTIEMYAAQKAFSIAGKGGKAVLRPLQKTALGKSAGIYAARVASKVRAGAKGLPKTKLRTQLTKAASKLKAASKKSSFKNKAASKTAALVKKLQDKRLAKSAKARQAGEIIRKIEINKKAINILKKDFKKLDRRSPVYKSTAKRIKSLEKGNKALNKRLKDLKVPASRLAKVRKQIKKQVKGKKPKAKAAKPKTTVSASIKIKPSVSAKVNYAARFVKLPSKKVLSSMRTTLRKGGYTIKRAKGRSAKALSKTAKRSLGNIKQTIITSKRITSGAIQRINRVIGKFGYKIAKIARAGKRAKTVGKLRREVANIKRARLLRNRYKSVVSGLAFKKNSIIVKLKKPLKALDARFQKAMDALNRALPVTIKLRIRTKNGKVISWGGAKKLAKGKAKPLQLPKVAKSKVKIRGKEEVQALFRKVKAGKVDISKLSARLRKRIRRLEVREQKLKKFLAENKDLLALKKQKQISQKRAQIARAKSASKDIIRRLARERRRARVDRAKSAQLVDKLRKDKVIKDIKAAQQAALRLSDKSANKRISAARKKAPPQKELPSGTTGLVQMVKLKPQKIQQVKKQTAKIRQAKTKKQLESAYKSAKKNLKGEQQQLITILKEAKSKGKLSGPKGQKLNNLIKSQLKAVAALGALVNNALTKSVYARKNNIKPIVTTRQRQPQKKKPAQKPKQVQKLEPLKKPDVVDITKKRLDSYNAVRQINTIITILGAAGAASLLRGLPKPGETTRNNLLQSLPAYRRRFFSWVRSKRFRYIPDLAALIFGQKARNKKKAAELLRRGRVFTGAGARLIVK